MRLEFAELAIKALFFDYDGVLWDSEVAALRSWQETYAEYVVSTDDTEWIMTGLRILRGEELVAQETRVQAGLGRTREDSGREQSLQSKHTPLLGPYVPVSAYGVRQT